MTLTVLTYNTLFAGRDGDSDRRAQSQAELIDELRPDVFLMQEAKGLDADGGRRLHALEARIGMRGFLAPAPCTGQHVAVFIRETLKPLSFEADSAHFHHALAVLTVALPGSGQPLKLMSAHLCPNGAEVRRREAAYLAVHAAPEPLSLLGGDFNSASPHDHEPDDFAVLPPHHRAPYLAGDGQSLDRSVMAGLEGAGWIDVARALEAPACATVPAQGFAGTEFATMRCDYVMCSKALATRARSYRVVRTPLTDAASDHYPVVVTFDLSR
jgi:exodeoxyribonuclease-3